MTIERNYCNCQLPGRQILAFLQRPKAFLLQQSIVSGICLLQVIAYGQAPSQFQPVHIVKRTHLHDEPPIHMAYPTQLEGREMIGPAGISQDAGRTWKKFQPTPDFTADLPYGYRRESFPAVLDPKSGRIVMVYNALDTPGVDPKTIEPPIALKSYYLRYRVSIDRSRTWLFDEPVVQQGHTEDNPLEGVWKGKNGVFFGDIGSVPIFTSRGELLAPVQICLLSSDGELANPGGGYTYHDVAILIGAWTPDNHLSWDVSQRVVGDPKRSTRGVCEPTLAELPDGRTLMIMRGSNSRGREHSLPSYRWLSVSNDGGRTWTKPEPWTYAGGEELFSPSSMSQLFKHSSGRVFWIGNITSEEINGNSPRWPLIIGEVDPKSLGLVKQSVVVIDTHKPDDPPRIDLSHFRAQEDRKTGEIILTVPRALNGYKSTTWTTYCLGVKKPELWLAPGVESLNVSNTGPFVVVGDGTLVSVRGGDALLSKDEGKTWEKNPVSASVPIDASVEQGIILTRAGTIVFGFLNNAAGLKWGWDDAKNMPIEGIRLPVWTARSTDGGKTWTDIQEVQGEYSGGVRQIIQLRDGRLVMPSQHMAYPQPYHTSAAFVSDDDGRTWKKSNTIDIGGRGHHDGAIEGTVFEHGDGVLQMFLRTSRNRFWQAFSKDRGLTWTDVGQSVVTASSSPGIVARLESDRLVLVWNDVYPHGRTNYPLFSKPGFQDRPSSWQREEMSIAFSEEDGRTWIEPKVIAKDPRRTFCNPNLVERYPGVLWITTQFGDLRVRLHEPDFIGDAE